MTVQHERTTGDWVINFWIIAVIKIPADFCVIFTDTVCVGVLFLFKRSPDIFRLALIGHSDQILFLISQIKKCEVFYFSLTAFFYKTKTCPQQCGREIERKLIHNWETSKNTNIYNISSLINKKKKESKTKHAIILPPRERRSALWEIEREKHRKLSWNGTFRSKWLIDF